MAQGGVVGHCFAHARKGQQEEDDAEEEPPLEAAAVLEVELERRAHEHEYDEHINHEDHECRPQGRLVGGKLMVERQHAHDMT